ncbi:MAG TPA: fatty acid desaturase family protein [Burkholderiaceae bacterium]|nr:fatty acid desaturase family protein [Burkholderiaceae bacterium]
MSASSAGAGTEFRDDRRAASARRLPAAVLQRLTRLDDRRSAAAVLLTLATIVGLLAAAVAIDRGWAYALAVPLIATQQHALFVLAHDAAHYRLFSNRSLNDRVGRALGSIAGISMCTYRVIHRLHHNHLYAELDPDVALNGGYPRGRAYLLRKLATDLSGLTAVKTYAYFFGSPSRNDQTDQALRPLDDTSPALRAAALADRNGVIAVQLALPVIVAVAGGWSALALYLLLWVLPAVTVLQAILRLRAVFEHGAPDDLASPLRSARTNVVGLLGRWLMFPHHVNYHIEHHLYPAVPHYRLPALHAALREHGLLDGADVCGWRGTWRRVYADRRDAAPDRSGGR